MSKIENDINNLNIAARMLPLETLVGDPLVSCVKAQTEAAMATRKYIRSLSKPDSTDAVQEIESISFIFKKEGKLYKLSVPLLTIVPIPYMHIDSVSLKFRADMSVDSSNNLVAKYAPQGNATASKTANSRYDIKNHLNVEIRATGNANPSGMDKILQTLNSFIVLRPSNRYKYYVNKRANATGEHEVHKADCVHLPHLDNLVYLGAFENSADALAAAKEKYLEVDGCFYCNRENHRR